MDLADVDPKYTDMCGERTLQEEEKGFFNGLVQKFVDTTNVTDWTQVMWAQRTYGTEYIECLIAEKEIFKSLNEIFSVQPMYRKKKLEVCTKAKKLAAKELSVGNFQKALAFCNQAVILSPCPEDNSDSSEPSLALALWLRAECLMKMNLYELALCDLQASMKSNLPKSHKGIFFHRQGECYKKTGDVNRAKISLELAFKLAMDQPNLKEKIKLDLEKLDVKNDIASEKPKTEDKAKNGGEGTTVESGSLNIVELVKKDGVGRFGVSKKNISIGENVVTEEPYASCLKQSSLGTHCSHCFQRLQAPFGCLKCGNLAFCSQTCRDAAMPYHKYECSFMDLLIGSGMSVLCNVALRIITQNGLVKSLKHYDLYMKEREKTDTYGDLREIEVNQDKDQIIYNLCTHTDQRTPLDYLKRVVMAFFLLNCLRKSGFFDDARFVFDDRSTSLNRDEVKIFAMLLYYIQMLQFNAHEIEETVKNDKAKRYKTKAIGVGIYPTVSLFNHDCHQSIGRYFVGKTICMKALKPIKAGEMLPENYGPIFTKQTKYARQRILRSRYWFKCQCTSCVEIWPNLDQLADDCFLLRFVPNGDCLH